MIKQKSRTLLGGKEFAFYDGGGQDLQAPAFAVLALYKSVGFIKVGDLHIFGIPQ